MERQEDAQMVRYNTDGSPRTSGTDVEEQAQGHARFGMEQADIDTTKVVQLEYSPPPEHPEIDEDAVELRTYDIIQSTPGYIVLMYPRGFDENPTANVLIIGKSLSVIADWMKTTPGSETAYQRS